MSKVRLILLGGAVMLALAGGVLLGMFMTRFVAIGVNRPTLPAVAVVQEIQTLSQLVTVRYVIEKVVVEEDVKWFGENRVLLVTHGVVKAGVDLERLGPEDIEITENRVHITLPPPQILDAYLDESKTQVIEHSTGLLRTFDKNLETLARQNAVMDIRRAARNEGILEEAEDRAQTQLEALLYRLGFEAVEISAP